MRIFKLIMSFLLLIYLSQSVLFGALSLTDWVDYPYGVQYANGNLNATVNDLNNKYNLWKQNYVTSSGAGGFQRFTDQSHQMIRYQKALAMECYLPFISMTKRYLTICGRINN